VRHPSLEYRRICNYKEVVVGGSCSRRVVAARALPLGHECAEGDEGEARGRRGRKEKREGSRRAVMKGKRRRGRKDKREGCGRFR
jgi:hypothetical protein